MFGNNNGKLTLLYREKAFPALIDVAHWVNGLEGSEVAQDGVTYKVSTVWDVQVIPVADAHYKYSAVVMVKAKQI